MANQIIMERFVWFEHEVKAGRHPNATRLARHFELSAKTAQRNIEFMRDRLGAPLEYEPLHRGYRYSARSFELPRLAASQQELLALLVARQLLSRAAGGWLDTAMRRLGRKLLIETAGTDLPEERLEGAFSAGWQNISPVPAEIFRAVTDALLGNRLLAFVYHSPGSGQDSRRAVEPHHLQHYMASWVLIAWCRLRGAWRKFHLARMEQVRAQSETFLPRPAAAWRPHLEGAFGIFQGADCVPVRLRFNPFRARWVRGQLWHPAQIMEDTPQGGLELEFPVADFREVKMTILQFGADVEVLAPEALRAEIAAEAARCALLYAAGAAPPEKEA